MTDFAIDYIGVIGLWFFLSFLGLIALVLHLKLTPEHIISTLQPYFIREEQFEEPVNSFEEESKAIQDSIETSEKEHVLDTTAKAPQETPSALSLEVEANKIEDAKEEDELSIEIKAVPEEEVVDSLSQELVEKYGAFDPTLELSGFQFPTLDLLKDYGSSTITIDEDELEINKNKIIDTLRNYKIEIAKIRPILAPLLLSTRLFLLLGCAFLK